MRECGRKEGGDGKLKGVEKTKTKTEK